MLTKNRSIRSAAALLLTSKKQSEVAAAEGILADQYTDGCRHCVADALTLYADDHDLPEDLHAHVEALLTELDARGDDPLHGDGPGEHYRPRGLELIKQS